MKLPGKHLRKHPRNNQHVVAVPALNTHHKSLNRIPIASGSFFCFFNVSHGV